LDGDVSLLWENAWWLCVGSQPVIKYYYSYAEIYGLFGVKVAHILDSEKGAMCTQVVYSEFGLNVQPFIISPTLVVSHRGKGVML
jgi:hypothetical protein